MWKIKRKEKGRKRERKEARKKLGMNQQNKVQILAYAHA